MEATGFFCQISTKLDQKLWVCSIWDRHSGTYEPTESLCSIWVLLDSQLFHCSGVSTSACNPQLVHENYFSVLRGAFQSPDPNTVYCFQVNEEENTADLELQIPVDSESKSFVTIFKVTLEKSFLRGGFSEFLERICAVNQLKDQKITEQQQRIKELGELKQVIEKTRTEVHKVKEETGPALAAQFLGILNDLKTKRNLNQMD